MTGKVLKTCKVFSFFQYYDPTPKFEHCCFLCIFPCVFKCFSRDVEGLDCSATSIGFEHYSDLSPFIKFQEI